MKIQKKKHQINFKRIVKSTPTKIVAVLLVIAIVWIIAYNIPHTTNDSNTNQQEQTVSRVSGKTAEQDKKDALGVATALLTDANKLQGNNDLSTALQSIQNNPNSVPQDMKDKIRFTDRFVNDPNSSDSQVSVYQSLVTLANYINKITGKSSITPTSDTSWKSIQLDQDVGSAFIPVSLFTGTGQFSMEMVYVNGQWQFSPYSLMDAISLSSSLSGSDSSSSPSASATP